MSLLERFRRFWLPGRGGADHPLSEEERESKPPDTAIGELADAAGKWVGSGDDEAR